MGVFSFGTVSDNPYIELAKKKNNKNPSPGGKPRRWRVLCCWEVQPGDSSIAVALEMILHVFWGTDLRHLCIEVSFADLTCSAFAMQAHLRGNFWKITIKPLHFSEYISGGLFSAQSQESVAISRYRDTAGVVTVATL